MPWTETRIMDSRVNFVSEFLEGVYSMSQLCRSYDISRKTGYKWIRRYESEGPGGLHNRSRAPHHHPHAISDGVKCAILRIKARFGHWGPAKIRARLERDYPRWLHYPAVSTIGEYLKREGLVCTRRRRRQSSPTEGFLTVGQASNDVWCADFKGHFRVGDGSRCNPLTISDHVSRHLLCCRHLDEMNTKLSKMHFTRVFREYGLPFVIRTDNGSPFSSRGLCGLSQLSYWWIRLGIHPERIKPGHPEQNGRHERIHRNLKAETAKPPASSLASQQKRFNRFMRDYNNERPHESLDMQTPSSCYRRSPRAFPERLPNIYYPDGMTVRRVQEHGDVHYLSDRIFITESLRGEYVGFERADEDVSYLWYCQYKLATLDHRRWRLEAEPSRAFGAGGTPGPKGS